MSIPGVQGMEALSNREFLTVWSPTGVRHCVCGGAGRASSFSTMSAFADGFGVTLELRPRRSFSAGGDGAK